MTSERVEHRASGSAGELHAKCNKSAGSCAVSVAVQTWSGGGGGLGVSFVTNLSAKSGTGMPSLLLRSAPEDGGA